MKTITYQQHEDLKRAAKRLKKELGITHSEALERLAKEAGFSSYHQLQRSVADQCPYHGLSSNAEGGYKEVPLGSEKIWFALEIKDAEKYDHSSFPQRWGIAEDHGKWNAITEDIKKAFPHVQYDIDHPAQRFYSDNRVFSLSLPNVQTLYDVVSYIREIFYWEPRFVFQNGIVFQCENSPVKMDYQEWIITLGKIEDWEPSPEQLSRSYH